MCRGHTHTSFDLRGRALLESEEIVKFKCTSYIRVGLRPFLVNFPPLTGPDLFSCHQYLDCRPKTYLCSVSRFEMENKVDLFRAKDFGQ